MKTAATIAVLLLGLCVCSCGNTEGTSKYILDTLSDGTILGGEIFEMKEPSANERIRQSEKAISESMEGIKDLMSE